MKSKRLLYTSLFVLIFAALLASCAAPVEEAPEPTDAPAPTDEPAEPAVDPSGQTIVFWHSMSSGANLEGMDAVVAEFNATNMYGITVEAISQGRQSELETAVNGAITTGELPNLTMGFPNGMSTWYGLGVIAPLNDFVNDADFGLSADAQAAIFPGPYSSGTMVDGTQIGIPMHQSAQVNFYNFTWAQELGFDSPPATSAEFKEQACAASAANNADDDPDNDDTGGYVLFPSASTIVPWVAAFDGGFLNDTGDSYTMNSQAAIDVGVFLKDLLDSGCTIFTPSFPNPEFAGRQALFATSSTAGQPFQQSAMDEVENDDVWGAIGFPGPNGTIAVNAFGQMVGIVATNAEQDLASWIFLQYLTSPETQATWIGYTGYFPSQSTTDVADRAASDPIWSGALALLPLGVAEPNLPSWGPVRGAIQDAYFAILDAEDEAGIIAILDELNDTAAELVAEME